MKLGFMVVVALAWSLPVMVFLLPPRSAHAGADPRVDPKGLFAEVSTSVDGASVRRIRDREEGVLCYVATGWNPGAGFAQGRSVTISCVQLGTVVP